MWFRKMLKGITCRAMRRFDAKCERGATLPNGVTAVTDVPYGEDKAETLDFYYPDGGEDLPLIVDIHGGGLVYGTKENNKRFCYALALQGYCVANINYGLAPEYTFVEQVRQTCKAVAFAQKNAPHTEKKELKTVIAGDSAGALLALLADGAAKTETVRSAYGLDGMCGAAADGLFLISGMYSFTSKRINGLAGLSIGKGKGAWRDFTDLGRLFDVYTPPKIFMTSSDGDFLKKSTKRFAELLTERGYPFKLDYKPKKNADGEKYIHIYPVKFPEWEECKKLLRNANAVLRADCYISRGA